jgi:hypothetical protein
MGERTKSREPRGVKLMPGDSWLWVGRVADIARSGTQHCKGEQSWPARLSSQIYQG